MNKNLSALKRNKIALRNRYYNKKYKTSIKNSIKKFLFSISNTNVEDINSINISNNLSTVYQKIDKAVKRGVLHKNKAARKKSRLVKMMKIKLNN